MNTPRWIWGLPVVLGAEQTLGLAYTSVIDLPADNNALAWDIYFVFEPGTDWTDPPPEPSAWWHQLAFDEHYLVDGESLRAALSSL